MSTALPETPGGSIVTVGSFDGVHRGHHAVLDEIARRARVAGRQSVLVTFSPHPLEVVNPAAAPPLLTAGDERLEILAQTARKNDDTDADWADSRRGNSCGTCCSPGATCGSW